MKHFYNFGGSALPLKGQAKRKSKLVEYYRKVKKIYKGRKLRIALDEMNYYQ